MKNKKSIYHYLRLFKNTNIAYNKFGITSLSQKKGLFKDLKRAYFDYGWEPYEYFQFEFFNKSVDEIKSYIPTKEHIKMVYFFNTEEDIKFLQNKYKTYTRYKDFFKRQVAYITKRNADVLTSMLKSHDRLILKPVDGTFGEGVRVINCKDYVDNHFLLFQEYPSGDFLVEELIDQLDDLARLHPASVNTIRIYSICYGSEVVVFHPWLRIGKGGSVIDNASAGGIGAALDFNTGEIISAGDKFGHRYETHPDTNIQLIGFKVPQWENLIYTVKRLALVNNNLHYVGWDMALSKDGWVLVEGNPRAQIGFQIMEKRGFRADLNSFLDKFGIKDKYYTYLRVSDD